MKAKDLEQKKVSELREYARKFAIPKYSRMRKDELIERIIEASTKGKSNGTVAGPKGPKSARQKGFTTARFDDRSSTDMSEAETRLRMKEAFASSQTAQKEYSPPKLAQSTEKASSPVWDKFTARDLPFEYGKNRVTILVIDPNFFYTYWEITEQKLKEGQRQAGINSKLTLRVYDVTDIEFNGSNAHTHVDIEIFERLGCWYVRLDRHGRNLIADIGFKSPDGRYLVIARSNVGKLPPLHMAPEGPIKWMAVDDLGNYVITEVEDYTEADLILLRKILGEDLFRRFMRGEFKGMLFSTVFKKLPDIREISLEFPSSPGSKPPSSRSLQY